MFAALYRRIITIAISVWNPYRTDADSCIYYIIIEPILLYIDIYRDVYIPVLTLSSRK